MSTEHPHQNKNSHSEPLPYAQGGQSLHFIGIGGIGMSGIARILADQGYHVSGSDFKDSLVLEDLKQHGIDTYIGHNSQSAEAVKVSDCVIVSTAVKNENPDYIAAQKAGKKIIHRSQALALAAKNDTFIAIAGTHGKTTTSSMAASMLEDVGKDPSFAIGGVLAQFGTNARFRSSAQSSGIFVAEADESDASFLNYDVDFAVVTNIEPDHLDFYKTEAAVFEAFEKFLAQLKSTAVSIVCLDDPGIIRLLSLLFNTNNDSKSANIVDKNSFQAKLIGYGTHPQEGIPDMIRHKLDSYYHMAKTEDIGSGLIVDVVEHDNDLSHGSKQKLEVSIPGLYNAYNAVAVYSLSQALGIASNEAIDAISHFKGVGRRFDLKGEENGIRVFDDYAHHPTEVEATLTGAQSLSGEGKVHVIFQPHLYSRTKEFATEFAKALDVADRVLVLDIFGAREDPQEGIDRSLITKHMTKAFDQEPSFDSSLLLQPQEIIENFIDGVDDGDIIMTVGAGDVTEYGDTIVDVLKNWKK